MVVIHTFRCPECREEWTLPGPVESPRKRCHKCGAEVEHEAEERP